MSEIAVKALEWSDEAGGEYITQSVIGWLHIGRPASYWNLTTPNGVVSSYETLDEAKSAAQSYFESRIRSCLLDKPEAVEGEAVDLDLLRGTLAWVRRHFEGEAPTRVKEQLDIAIGLIVRALSSSPSKTAGESLRIASAIEACDWSNTPIGNKEILKAAVAALRLVSK